MRLADIRAELKKWDIQTVQIQDSVPYEESIQVAGTVRDFIDALTAIHSAQLQSINAVKTPPLFAFIWISKLEESDLTVKLLDCTSVDLSLPHRGEDGPLAPYKQYVGQECRIELSSLDVCRNRSLTYLYTEPWYTEMLQARNAYIQQWEEEAVDDITEQMIAAKKQAAEVEA